MAGVFCLTVPPLISPAGLVEKWPPEGGRISLEQGLQLSLDPAGGFASPCRGVTEEVDHHVATGIVTESVVDAPEATQGIQVGDRPEVWGFPIAADFPSDVLQCAGFHFCLSWGGVSSLLRDKRTNPPEVCSDRSEDFLAIRCTLSPSSCVSPVAKGKYPERKGEHD